MVGFMCCVMLCNFEVSLLISFLLSLKFLELVSLRFVCFRDFWMLLVLLVSCLLMVVSFFSLFCDLVIRLRKFGFVFVFILVSVSWFVMFLLILILSFLVVVLIRFCDVSMRRVLIEDCWLVFFFNFGCLFMVRLFVFYY